MPTEEKGKANLVNESLSKIDATYIELRERILFGELAVHRRVALHGSPIIALVGCWRISEEVWTVLRRVDVYQGTGRGMAPGAVRHRRNWGAEACADGGRKDR